MVNCQTRRPCPSSAPTSTPASPPSPSPTPSAATPSPCRWSPRSSTPSTSLEADPAVGAVVVTGDGPGVLRRRRPVAPVLVRRGRRRGRAARDLRGLPPHRPVAAPHARRGQRRRRRRRHEPGPRLRRAARRRTGPGSTPASSSSACTPAAATPGWPSASPARRRCWPRCCSARCSTAPRPSGSGWCGAACPTTSCSPPRRRWPSARPAGPTSSCARIKATIHDVAAIDDHAAAVDRELEPQVWSLEQPAFKERRRRPPGQDHHEVAATLRRSRSAERARRGAASHSSTVMA